MKKSISRFLHSTWAVISSVTIRVKILGMTLGLLLLLGLGITAQVRSSLTNTLSIQLSEESVTVGRDLAARATDLILLNDLVGLQNLISETQSNNPSVRYAFIVDTNGQVLVHTFGPGFPVDLLDVNTAAPDDHHQTIALETEEGKIWDTAVPILAGQAGSARVGLSDSRLQQALQSLTRQLMFVTLAVVVLGVFVAIFLTWILTRPILELVEATQRVAQGDYSIKLNRWADDEIGDLADAFNTMTVDLARTDEIRQEREELRRQLLEKVILAQEDERRRISRELHDSTSQSLTSLMVGLKAMDTLCNNILVHSHAEDLRGVVAQTLDEIHAISTQLRPNVLDDLGLTAALERLADEWETRHKTIVDSAIQIGGQRLPGEIETAVYRIVQEALTNIAKYAQADSVSLLVELREHELVAVIEDNGIGFNMAPSPERPHLGLIGMRERAELLGGQLTIESQAGLGTNIFIRIPTKVSELSV
jgi:signal transduction histidine kinase